MTPYLRCHEFGSTTKRTRCLTEPHLLFTQPIIRDFHMAIQCQQDVIQFQITVPIRSATNNSSSQELLPVYDSIRMEVFESEEDFRSIKLGLSQGELLSLNVKHEITSAHIFHDEIHASLGLET